MRDVFSNLIRGEIGACIEHRFEAKIKQIVEMEVLKTHIEKLKVDDTWAIVLHAAVEGEHIMKMIESMVTDKKPSQRYQTYGIEYAARHLGKFYFNPSVLINGPRRFIPFLTVITVTNITL